MSAVTRLLTDHIDLWTAADTEKKSGRGRSATGSGSVYGIKKLRELILELAVRGKLVPQDPNDEPASELLRRQGKAKKQGVSSSGEKFHEKLFALPLTWEWVNLPEISSYKVGKTPSTKSSIYWTERNDGTNWVSIADLNDDGEVTHTAKRVSQEAASEVFRSPPSPAGTILMSFKLTLGKVSFLKNPAYHNEAIISIFPTSAILDRYLFKILPSRAQGGNTKSAIKGNTLNSASIAALKIPLPPLAEQQRIVAKVDELMALCDQLEAQHSDAAEAHEKLVKHLLGTLTNSENADDFAANWQRITAHFDTLFTTEASVDVLKQTILQLAVMGNLVPQDPADKPASDLLQEIIDEKKLRRLKSNDGDLSVALEIDDGFKIPSSWIWTNLGLLTLDMRYGTAKKCDYKTKGTPVLRIPNVSGGLIDLDDMKFGELTDKEITDLRLIEGDLLIIRSNGSLDIVGRATEVNAAAEGMAFAGYLVRVRLPKASVFPKYIWLALKTKHVRDQIEIPIRSAVGLKNVNSKELSALTIPLPPLSEQRRITEKVDGLMVLCDELKSRLNMANLIQQKFADELVAQAVV